MTRSKMDLNLGNFAVIALMVALSLGAGGTQVPDETDFSPIRYLGPGLPDFLRPDGGLRPVVGVKNYQVFRASRACADLADARGWTYNHAPMLAYWKGKFYAEFISSPVDEHGWPTEALLTSSVDGRQWDKPQIAFPAWEGQREGKAFRPLIHQRMGFYVAPNDRLLVISHYGVGDSSFGGPGHVLREVYATGSLGPIYFIRFGKGWSVWNGFYPFYLESRDKGFLEACRALLANSLITDQWFELQQGYPADAYLQVKEPYQPKEQRKALSFFHRKDGKVVGIWKKAWVSLSDGGGTWTKPVQATGIARTFAKIWGQPTEDGRYALAFDPQDHPPGNRWPLAVITSDDGVAFDGMLAVHGEVPLRRYSGNAKDIGPQYVRGIAEGNGDAPGRDLWVIYSVNKEDIWVSRIPVPVRSQLEVPVNEDFDHVPSIDALADWNIYSPRWAPVTLAQLPGSNNTVLKLEDRDPFDYARAVRVLPQSRKLTLSFKVLAQQADHGELEIELLSGDGRRPVLFRFSDLGRFQALDGQRVKDLGDFVPGRWHEVRVDLDLEKKIYQLLIDRKSDWGPFALVEPVASVERLSFRTGETRGILLDQAGPQVPVDGPPDELKYFADRIESGTDCPLRPAVFLIDEIRTENGFRPR